MTQVWRGAAFFAVVSPAAVGTPGTARPAALLAGAERAFQGRGRARRLSQPGLSAVLVAEAFGAEDEPALGPYARLSAGVGAAEVSLELTGEGARLRADALGRRTLHGTILPSGELLVASSIGPLLEARRATGLPTAIDPLAMRRFFTYSFIPAPFTAFREIFTVPAGHTVSWTRGRGLHPFERVYDVPATRGLVAGSDDEAADLLTRTLDEVLRPPLGGRPGVLLSGGLDSAFVACAAREMRDLVALTLDFEEDSEADAAAAIAHALGIRHCRIAIDGRQAVAGLQRAAAALDTPIGDPVVAPFLLLAEQTDRTVLLTGEGGDQLFAGWATKPMLAWARYAGPDDDIAEAYAQTFHKLHDVRDEAFGPALRDVLFHPADDLRPFLSDARLARHDGLFHLLCDANLWLKGAGNILPRIDRCLAAAGIEAHSPFLDERFVDAAFRVGARQKQRGTTEKWILRHALRETLPAAVLDLPKRGMRVPVTRWLAGELGVFARDILTSSTFARSAG